jgi:protein-S-isoprenylcysteine O-methyltransferase Ste14
VSLVPAFAIGIWNAWILCLVFLFVQFALMILLNRVYNGTFARASAPSSTKKIDRLVNTVLIIALIYSVFLPLKLGEAWFYASISIYSLGLVVLIVASINFAATPLDEPITKGIYKHSRHPMYMVMILVFLGISGATASWLFFLFFLAFVILVNIEAASEERFCLEKYGAAYRDYMDKTPRWVGIPR